MESGISALFADDHSENLVIRQSIEISRCNAVNHKRGVDLFNGRNSQCS